MAFDSTTAIRSRYCQQIQQLQDIVQKQYRKIQTLKNKNSELQAEISHNQSDLSTAIDAIDDEYSTLKIYLRVALDNVQKNPQGRRYEKLKPFFTLVSLVGEHYYNIFADKLLFPSYKTALRYRKEYMSSMNITDELFSGEPKSIQMLIDFYLQSGTSNKCTIIVDAAQ